MGITRHGEVIAVVGAKRHGKSTFVRKLVDASTRPNALVYKEGANVYDEAFKGYKVIGDLTKYTGGKCIVDGSFIEYKDFLKKCYINYRNGVLVIDDAGMYEYNDVSVELRKIAVPCRRLGLDVVYVYHSLSDMPIRLFQYINKIVLFHTTDNESYKLKKIPAYDQLGPAKARIAAQVARGNRYYNELIVLS